MDLFRQRHNPEHQEIGKNVFEKLYADGFDRGPAFHGVGHRTASLPLHNAWPARCQPLVHSVGQANAASSGDESKAVILTRHQFIKNNGVQNLQRMTRPCGQTRQRNRFFTDGKIPHLPVVENTV